MLAGVSTEEQTSAQAATPPPSRWTAGRIVLVVLGSIVALVGVALLAGGGALLWVDQSKRDDDGYLTTPTERFSTSSYAITTESIDLVDADTDSPDWILSQNVLGNVRLRGESQEGEIFLGIGPTVDVESYLGGVEHDEVADLEFDPFAVDYRRRPGDAPSGPPTEQDFWAASATGQGVQTATWDVEGGEWSVVVMNADGSEGVSAELSAGAEADFLLWLAIGLLIAGAVLMAGGAAMIYAGARHAAAAAPAPVAAAVPGAAAATVYPVAVAGELDPSLSRWLWLVKWLLAIPHYIVLFFLWIAFGLLTIVAFFAILFTGRYPRGIFDFNVGVLRWTWRVSFYSYWALGTDRYPPFTLAPVPDYPATLDVDYPERLTRWLPLVKWLLAIPHLILVAIFVGGWGWGPWGEDFRGLGFSGLVGVLVVIAGFVLLFTGRYPQALFDFALGLDRWALRVLAYVGLMRDEYPPFRLDMGPREPAPSTEAPAQPEPR
jgi:Domain of unknown function (DUF4389)